MGNPRIGHVWACPDWITGSYHGSSGWITGSYNDPQTESEDHMMDPQSGSEDPLMILSLEQRILRLYERIPEIMISSTVKCMKIMYSDGN